eukprot:TRINITY_DN8566_c0_g2_i1.p2 TRINITY_DN8566_c0_g2~~TRINITY_DN8566_c0_g2_i1.p2  ORF type:complete len:1196 (+),score=435.00 TRINITY_DN8566_c0_g2_i1:97-3684(+)
MRMHRGLLVPVLAAMVPSASGQCATAVLGGDWFDSASSAAMAVTQSGCSLTSKYGSVTVEDALHIDGAGVMPQDGLLKDLGITGRYRRHTGTIEWSNGMTWSRGTGMVELRLASIEASLTNLVAKNTALEAANGALETRVTALETKTAQMQSEIDALKPCCSGGGPTSAAPPPPPPVLPSPPPPVVPSPPPPDAPAAGDSNASAADIEALWAAIREFNETRPRDGWCMTQPNSTDVYVPVDRYAYRNNRNGDTCVIGGTVPRAGSAPGGPPIKSRVDLYDTSCRWGSDMRSTGAAAEPMLAYVGDTVHFWRAGSTAYTIYEFMDRSAWEDCDFAQGKLVAGKIDLSSMEKAGKNFTRKFTQAGTYYFASDKQGEPDPLRREYCWDKTEDPSKKSWNNDKSKIKKGSWGRGAKIEIQVLDPTEEVMLTCPLYDPSKYGVAAGSGEAADSATVTKMKGALAAVVRQLISYESRIQERVREQGQSGMTVTRSTGQGTDAYHEPSYATGGVANIHNHANTHHTIGMGEWGGVLNGVQWTTRHNDYSLRQPDYSKTPAEYVSDWPPKSVEVVQPPVPPSVLSAGNVDKQITEMREYFRAWKEQDTSIRDYKPYFKAVMCYTEAAWTLAQDAVAEPFASERHHIDADTWKELNEKTRYLFATGQKNSAENLPFLPSAILDYRDEGDATFEPVLAQWFYRINCFPLPEDLPLKRFRVRNELHLQLRENPPKTREQMAEGRRALFELNPELEENWKPTNPWPKTKTSWEFMDQLVSHIPGLDGPNAVLYDDTFGPMCSEYLDGSKDLNTAFYSRYYSLKQKDAMGRTTQKRSFHDLMFAAQTTHPKIVPYTVCHQLDADQLAASTDKNDAKRVPECEQIKDESDCLDKKWDKVVIQGTAESARCYWTSGRKCVYQKCWTQRWSYMMPMEIIFLTPLVEWDPYGIGYCSDKKAACYNAVTDGGMNGKESKPYKGARQDIFFRTPVSFFTDTGSIDAADTSGGVTFVSPQSGAFKGQKVKTRASGHWIHFPDITGLGELRQRYPIFPIHEHGNTIWKEVKALEEIMVGKDSRKELMNIFLETRAGAYGTELELISAPDSHTHTVSISAAETMEFEAGTRTEIVKTSTLGDGHTHRVKIGYDAAKAAKKENPWFLKYCTMSSDGCPGSLANANPPGCGDNGASVPFIVCCNDGTCPDQHPGVRVFV